MSEALLRQWSERVRAAAAERRVLRLRGGGSKDFYGSLVAGELFDTRAHAGIVDYQASELVVTVRCGTPLAELEAELGAQGQMLAFEPPRFGGASASATVGGMFAAGLSGPRRQAAGALRDFVLGAKLMDGRGEVLSFGGQVMKNVAGYDVSRLLAGSLGTLGIVLEVSLKTLPRPAAQATLRFAFSEEEAIAALNRWAGQPLPITASAFTGGELMLRLSGAASAVQAAVAQLGGERMEEGAGHGSASGEAWWESVREQRHGFFAASVDGDLPLWRLSLPSTTPAAVLDALPAGRFIEWGGALRWLAASPGADLDAQAVREAAARAGGHATLFRNGDKLAGAFQPLQPALMAIHRRLKEAFDPQRVFNPGRLYPEF